VLRYEPGWGQPGEDDVRALTELMRGPEPELPDLGPAHPGWAADMS
jgi:hypothetical protein